MKPSSSFKLAGLFTQRAIAQTNTLWASVSPGAAFAVLNAPTHGIKNENQELQKNNYDIITIYINYERLASYDFTVPSVIFLGFLRPRPLRVSKAAYE